MSSSKCVSHKTGFRGKTINIPTDNAKNEPKNGKSRRFCIGGRGREWGPECFKVLERMSKREDTQMFMQPIDAVKHPEYYTLVKEPIDLLKIQLKFHSGMYQSMFSFVDDVGLMFNNHLLLYDRPSDPIHQNIHKIKSWFEDEMEKIRTKWFFFGAPGTTTIRNSGKVSAKTTHMSKEIVDRIDAIEAENRNIVGSPLVIDSSPALSSQTNLTKIKSRVIVKNPFQNLKAISEIRTKDSPILLTKIPLNSNKSTEGRTTGDLKPMYAIRFSKTPSGQKIIFSPQATTNTNIAKNIPILPNHPNGNKITSSSKIVAEKDESELLILRSDVPKNNVEKDEVNTMEVDTTNMWLGVTQVKPTRPVVIDDGGILIHFSVFRTIKRNHKGGRISEGKSLEFLIRPDELVKCYAYVNNLQKHTIFLMVLPNCVRRLTSLLDVNVSKPQDGTNSFVDSCLITMFTPAMNRIQISQLMYFMWSIGKSNIFGCNLYAEINQKAALNLLGNVKPNLVTHFEGGGFETTIPNRSGHSNEGEGDEDDDDDNLEFIEGSSLMGKVQSEKVLEDNKNDDQSDAGTSTSSQQQQEEEQLTENIELEEISLDDIQLKEEPSYEGFPEEIIVLDKAKADLALACDEDGGQHSIGLKPRHKPGILSKRTSKRKMNSLSTSLSSSPLLSPSSPLLSSSCKRKKLENINKSAKASARLDLPLQASGTVGDDNDDEMIVEVKDIYSDNNKDLEIVLPNETETEIGDLEIKFLDHTEEGELIWTGRKINTRCPITQKVMTEPVKNKFCGHTYDKIGVQELIKNRGSKARCPVPGCRNVRHLELKDLDPDEAVRRVILNT